MVKRWLELGLSGRKSTHTHTHSCSNQPQSPDSKAQRKLHLQGVLVVALHVAAGGVLLRWAPWTSHLEGNCCAFQLACPGRPERATPRPAHTENPHVSKTPPASPTGLGEREKIIQAGLCRWLFLSQNNWKIHPWMCCPESRPSVRGQSWGLAGAGRRSAAPSCTHTLHSVSLKIPGLPGTLPAVHHRLEAGITPRRSLCQCPCTPRRCSWLWHRGTSGPDWAVSKQSLSSR